MNMSKQVSKRVAAASAVVDALRKSQRQLLAVTYEEAVCRRAKSVQVSLTPKGVLRTSVYLEWPAHELQAVSQVDDSTAMEMEVDQAPMARAAQVDTQQMRATDAPPKAAKPRVTIDKPPITAKPTPSASSVRKFTVHEPAKQNPSKGKATTAKVDKNALSARSQPPPVNVPVPPAPAPAPQLLVPPPPPSGGPLALPPSMANVQGSWTEVVYKKKGRSPPASPSYASAFKASRGSSEASEIEADDSAMGDSDDARDSVPATAEPPLDSLLTYEQVLQWWEEEHVPVWLAKGWTRKEIDADYRRREDGKPGGYCNGYPRPRRDRDGVVLKTRDAWFGRKPRPRPQALLPQGP